VSIAKEVDKLRLWLETLNREGLLDSATVAGAISDAIDAIPPGDGSYTPPTYDAPTVPTGLTATGLFGKIMLGWDAPGYSGHSRTEIWRAEVDDLGLAVKVGEAWTPDVLYVDSSITDTSISKTYYYWIRFVNKADLAGAFNGSAGTSGSTANDPAYILELMLNRLGYEHFDIAGGVFPITTVTELPVLPDPLYPAGVHVYLTTDGKLYKSTGTEWIAGVAASDITGQLTDDQIAAIAAAKLTGQIVSTQISDGAISTPKLAAGSVETANLAAGAITAEKIAALAITAAQIAAGAIDADKVAANAIIAGKIAAGAIVAGDGVISNAAIDTAQIIDATISTAKIQDLAVNNAKIVDLSVDKLIAGIITASNIYLGVDSRVHLDGANQRIIVNDGFRDRVHLGNLGTGWGLQIWDAAGNTILNSGGVPYDAVTGTKPPANADVTDYTDYRVSNITEEGAVTTIARPVAASLSSNDSPVTGCIVVTLPQGWTNTMMKMVIDVYLYEASKSFSLSVGGYNYSGGSLWVNTFAQLSGNAASNNRVRFGINPAGKCCIVVGETTSNWYYPKITVKDFQAGHSNYAASQWATGWAVTISADLTGYAFTGDFADSLLDAKSIVGQGALATSNTADWGTQVGGTGKPANNADVTANNPQSPSWLSSPVVWLNNKISAGNIASYMSSLAITNAYIGTAAIHTANIQDAAVQTLKIGVDQVTVPEGAYTAGGVVLSVAIATIQSVSINSGGFPVIVNLAGVAHCQMDSEGGIELVTVSLYRGVTLLLSFVIGGYAARGTFALSYVDTSPGAGTVWYYLKAVASSSGLASINNRALTLLGAKR
jgi:hypothetical protein